MLNDSLPLAYGLLTHWDREWYSTQATYEVRLLAAFNRVLEGLDSGELPSFCLDGQTSLLEDALALKPEWRAPIARAVEQGKLNVGPWYTMPDTLLVGLEPLIRNLQLGIKQAEALGCQEFTGYLPDTFGHASCLPGLFRQFGLRHAMVWRGRRLSASGSAYFWWRGEDGTTLLTYQLPEGYLLWPLHDPALAPLQRQAEVDQLKQKVRQAGLPAWLPLGGDHLAPPDAKWLEALKQADPETPFLLPPAFMRLAEQKPEAGQWPLEQGTLLAHGKGAPFILAGCWSARLHQKAWNRRLEHKLSQWIEPLLALAKMAKIDHTDLWEPLLEQAWKRLLQNQAHDGICGCSLDPVHQEIAVRFQQVEDSLSAMEAYLLRGFEALGNRPSPDVPELQLTHMSQWPYYGVLPVELRLPAGTRPPEWACLQWDAQETVLKNRYESDPADLPMSDRTESVWQGWLWLPPDKLLAPYSVNRLPLASLAGCAAPETPVTFTWVEAGKKALLKNGLLEVTVSTEQGIAVVDKSTGKQFEPLHQPMLSKDTGDSYNRCPVIEAGETVYPLTRLELLAQGPLAVKLQLTYSAENCPPLSTTLTLLAEEPLLRFESDFTPTEPNQVVQVGFESEQIITETAAENQTGLHRWPHRDTSTLEQRYQGYPITDRTDEWRSEGGVMQRFVSWQHQSVLGLGLPDYEIAGKQLRLTLHRGFGEISGGKLPSRGAPAGPPFETPEAQGLNQPQARRYAWCPTRQAMEDTAPWAALLLGSTKVKGRVERAEALNQPHPEANLAPQTWRLPVPQLPQGVSYSTISFTPPKPQGLNQSGPVGGLTLRLLNRNEQAVSLPVTAFNEAGLWTLNAKQTPLTHLGPEAVLTLPARAFRTVCG